MLNNIACFMILRKMSIKDKCNTNNVLYYPLVIFQLYLNMFHCLFLTVYAWAHLLPCRWYKPPPQSCSGAPSANISPSNAPPRLTQCVRTIVGVWEWVHQISPTPLTQTQDQLIWVMWDPGTGKPLLNLVDFFVADECRRSQLCCVCEYSDLETEAVWGLFFASSSSCWAWSRPNRKV